MTTRTPLINTFLEYLRTNTSANKITRGMLVLDKVNDFPTICVHAGRETRQAIGGGVNYGFIQITLRGYVHSENSTTAAENLATEIEAAVELYAAEQCSNNVQDARVTYIRTDEGLFDPYGILDMGIVIQYLIE